MTAATAQHQVQQAVVDALKAAPALAGGRVYANRVRPISAPSADGIAVRLDRSSGAQPTLHAIDWRTSIAVECYSRTATGADPAAAVDALLHAAWQRLCAMSAPGLGLMDLTIDPDISWDYDDGEQPVVCATVRLTATHRTPANSLTAWT